MNRGGHRDSEPARSKNPDGRICMEERSTVAQPAAQNSGVEQSLESPDHGAGD
jgi:hypothetical protein